MKVRKIVLDLDESEAFQFVVEGNNRMLVEQIELRGLEVLAGARVRLQGWTVPEYGQPFADERLREITDLPAQIQADLEPYQKFVGGN